MGETFWCKGSHYDRATSLLMLCIYLDFLVPRNGDIYKIIAKRIDEYFIYSKPNQWGLKINNFKWTKILGAGGLIIGGISAANQKINYPTEILGYAIPYFVLFLIIGFVVDFISSKK